MECQKSNPHIFSIHKCMNSGQLALILCTTVFTSILVVTKGQKNCETPTIHTSRYKNLVGLGFGHPTFCLWVLLLGSVLFCNTLPCSPLATEHIPGIPPYISPSWYKNYDLYFSTWKYTNILKIKCDTYHFSQNATSIWRVPQNGPSLPWNSSLPDHLWLTLQFLALIIHFNAYLT